SSLFASWRVPERAGRPLRTLGTATFGIFLVHFAVIVVLREALPALAPHETVPMAITWVLTVLVSALIALIGQRVPGRRLVSCASPRQIPWPRPSRPSRRGADAAARCPAVLVPPVRAPGGGSPCPCPPLPPVPPE